MEDYITINANISSAGFEKGTKAMKNALSSLSKSASQFGRMAGRSVNSVMSNIKRLAPMIIGVGSAYQILSKAVNAYMSQNEQLSKQMSAIWTSFGNLIGPIIERLVSWVTTAVSYLPSFLKVLGVTSKTASQLSKSSKQTGSDLKKTIAGFDELNTLSDNSGGGSGAGSLQDIEPSEWMNKLAELLKKGLWDDAATMIVDRFNELISIFAGKAAELGDKIGYYLGGIVHIIARIINDTDWHALGNAFAVMMNHIIRQIDGRDIGKILVAKITIAIKAVTGFLEGIDAKAWADLATGIITGALDALTEAIQSADWQKIGTNIATFIREIDWSAVFTALTTALGAAFGGIAAFLIGLIQPGWTQLKNWWAENAYSDGEFSMGKLLEGLAAALVGIGQWLIDNIWTPFSEAFWSTFDPDGTIQATLVEWAAGVREKIEEFRAKVEEAKEKVALYIEAIKTKFNELKQKITTVIATIKLKIEEFRTKIELLKTKHDEFKAKADEVWNAAWTTIQTCADWILEKWQALKDGITSVKDWIDEKVTGIQTTWTGFWNGLKDTVKGWANGVIDMINSVISAINSFSHLSYGGLSVNLPFGGGTVDVIPGFDLQLFNIPPIPPLAKGGVLKKGQMGFLEGDGSEAVVPLEKNTGWIDKIAEKLSERIRIGDFNFERIGGMLASLMDIRDTTRFQMPAIAAGAVLPYSVAESSRHDFAAQDGADLLAELQEMRGILNDLREDFQTMQFVAQFGDLRALARRITKEQRRDQIADGR